MKKLIAVCCFVLAVASVGYAHKNAPKKDLGTQVTEQIANNLRVVDVTLYPADNSAEQYHGKAVILSVDLKKSKVNLLFDVTLTQGVDLIDQVSTGPILGKLTNGILITKDAVLVNNFSSVNVQHRNRPEHLYRADFSLGKLTGNNAHNAQLLRQMPVQEAVKLLK